MKVYNIGKLNNRSIYMEIDEYLTTIEKRNEIRMMKSYIQCLEKPPARNGNHHKQWRP